MPIDGEDIEDLENAEDDTPQPLDEYEVLV
jgi:hypothetical protein